MELKKGFLKDLLTREKATYEVRKRTDFFQFNFRKITNDMFSTNAPPSLNDESIENVLDGFRRMMQ